MCFGNCSKPPESMKPVPLPSTSTRGKGLLFSHLPEGATDETGWAQGSPGHSWVMARGTSFSCSVCFYVSWQFSIVESGNITYPRSTRAFLWVKHYEKLKKEERIRHNPVLRGVVTPVRETHVHSCHSTDAGGAPSIGEQA